MARIKRIGALLIALAVAGLGLVATPAQAADGWGISPYSDLEGKGQARELFQFDAAAGELLEDSVWLVNDTDEPLPLELYPADGYNTADGTFSVRTKAQEKKQVGAWVALMETNVTVPPRTATRIGFTLAVPPDSLPGDYAGAIVGTPVSAEKDPVTGVQVQVGTAVGTRIYLSVDGESDPALEIVDITLETGRNLLGLSTGPATLKYTVKNTGNQQLSPTSSVTIEGLFGRDLAQVEDRTIRDLLPGQQATFVEELDDLPPMDRVVATVTLTAPELTVEADTVAWVGPWLLIVLLLIVGLAWTLWRRRRNRTRDAADDASVGSSARRGSHRATAARS